MTTASITPSLTSMNHNFLTTMYSSTCLTPVISSASGDWEPGTPVTVNGFDVGEAHWGGFAERARMKSEWLTPLPEGMSAAQAAAIGTAGYTAMLSVIALEQQGVTPTDGPVIVTGAAGGVGSVAVAVLAKLGFEVIASTGRNQESPFRNLRTQLQLTRLAARRWRT